MKEKEKAWIRKVVLGVGLSLLLGLGLGYYLIGDTIFSATMQLVSNEETVGASNGYLQDTGFDLDAFQEKYPSEKLELTSSLDGHVIPADYITAAGEKNHHTVILIHGLGGNRLSTMPVAELFLEAGYNVLAYDQRSSGENTAQYTTYGYWESRDFRDCLTYVDGLVDESKKLAAWGISFGGATLGIALGEESVNQSLDYAILDCPLGSMRYTLQATLEQMGAQVPVKLIMWVGNLYTKQKLGFGYDQAEVKTYTAKTTVPTLIIGTEKDSITPVFMAEDIYASIAAPKERFIVSDSEHAHVQRDHPQEYRQAILHFLGK